MGAAACEINCGLIYWPQSRSPELELAATATKKTSLSIHKDQDRQVRDTRTRPTSEIMLQVE